jgi:hypothetical protein
MARDEKGRSYQGPQVQCRVTPLTRGQLLGVRLVVDEVPSRRAPDSSTHFRRPGYGNQLLFKFILDI